MESKLGWKNKNIQIKGFLGRCRNINQSQIIDLLMITAFNLNCYRLQMNPLLHKQVIINIQVINTALTQFFFLILSFLR